MFSTLRPKEYEIVQGVFAELIASEWFDRDVDTEQACARLVLRRWNDGNDDHASLLAACEEEARRRFSKRDR